MAKPEFNHEKIKRLATNSLFPVAVIAKAAGKSPRTIARLLEGTHQSSGALRSLIRGLQKLDSAKYAHLQCDDFVLGNASKDQPAVPDSFSKSLFPGYLHRRSISTHNVREEVEDIINRNGVIPTKYLFAHAESFALYQTLIRESGFSIVAKGDVLFREHAAELAGEICRSLPGRHVTLVSLGVGYGQKEEYLIRELLDRNIQPSLLVIDINPAFIHFSITRLRKDMGDHKIWCRFIIGDFDHIEDYTEAFTDSHPVVFMALGGTFGNQGEEDFIRRLQGMASGPAFLLMDFQTKESLKNESMGGYNLDANKRFIRGIIRAFHRNDDVELTGIEATSDQNDPLLKRMALSRVKHTETIVMVATTTRERKRILAGYSSRYSEERLREFFRDSGVSVRLAFSDSSPSAVPKPSPDTYLFLCELQGDT